MARSIMFISVFTLLVVLFLPLSLGAVPTSLRHSGHILQSNNEPLSGSSNVTFTLYNNADQILWSEEISVTFDDGHYSVELNTDDVFDSSTVFLGVTLEGQEEFTPRVRLTSVPYAFRSGVAQQAVEPAENSNIATNTYVDEEILSHTHDSYTTSTELQTSDGDAPNTGSNLVSWNNLVDVPEGFADGSDDGGSGSISGTTDVISKFSESGLTDSAIFESGGNVGIGTVDPNEVLTVDGVLSVKKIENSPEASSEYGKIYYTEGGGSGVDSNVVLLIHSDSPNGSTGFVDSSASNHTISPQGQANHSTFEAKFGQSSIHFDANEDYLQIADSDDWDFGTGDFTIDLWAYPISYGESGSHGGFITTAHYGPSSGWILRYNSNQGSLMLQDASTGTYYYSEGEVPLHQWTHVALVRSGNTLYYFFNGVMDPTQTITAPVNGSSSGLMVGDSWFNHDNYEFDGYIDEVRVSKGVARWTDDFSDQLSSAPYGEASGTTLYFVNETGNRYNLTQGGTATSNGSVRILSSPHVDTDCGDAVSEGNRCKIDQNNFWIVPSTLINFDLTQRSVVKMSLSATPDLGNVNPDNCEDHLGLGFYLDGEKQGDANWGESCAGLQNSTGAWWTNVHVERVMTLDPGTHEIQAFFYNWNSGCQWIGFSQVDYSWPTVSLTIVPE